MCEIALASRGHPRRVCDISLANRGLTLQRYFFFLHVYPHAFAFVCTISLIEGESRTVHGCGVVLDLILMRWFVSSVSGKNKRTHTHTHTTRKNLYMALYVGLCAWINIMCWYVYMRMSRMII